MEPLKANQGEGPGHGKKEEGGVGSDQLVTINKSSVSDLGLLHSPGMRGNLQSEQSTL